MLINQRLDYIDMAKGFAIALMVFGHTFSTYQNMPIPIMEQIENLMVMPQVEYNTDFEEHNRYLNENVSGALQLSLGFSIIPLIDEKFSDTFGLNKNNSIIYKNNDLFSAMVKAINMDQNSYISLQNELTSLQMKYREESINNIKNYLQYLE